MPTGAEFQAAMQQLAGRQLTYQELAQLGLTPTLNDQFVQSSFQGGGVLPKVGDYTYRAGDANLGDYGGMYQLTADSFDGRAGTPLSDLGANGEYGAYSFGLTYDPTSGQYTLGDPTFNQSENAGNSTLLDRFGSNLDWIGPLIVAAAAPYAAPAMYEAGLGMGASGMGAASTGAAGAGAAGAGMASGGANAFGESGTLLSNETGAVGASTGGVGAGTAAGATGAGTTAGTTAAGTAGTASTLSQLLASPAAAPLAGAAVGALAGSQDSTTTNSTQVDPALAAYMQQYRDLAAQTAAIPFESYTGQRVAGLTGTQQAAGGALQGQVDNIPALRAQIGGLVGAGTTNLSAAQNAEMDQIRSMLSGLTAPRTATANPYADMSNPYLQGAIAASNRGLADSYNTLVAPKYSQGSSFGNSGLAEYEALDRANLARQMSDNSNTLSYQGYNQAAQLAESGATRQDTINNLLSQLGLQGAQVLGQLGESQAGRSDQMATGNATRSLQGAQILGNSEQQYASLINNLLNYGNQEQLTNQAGLDAQYEEFLRRIQYPQQQLSIYGQGLAANPGSTSTSTTPGNLWTGAAGGALLGAQVQRLMNQPAGSTQQQVISSPTFQSPDYANLFNTQNSRSLFGTTVGG